MPKIPVLATTGLVLAIAAAGCGGSGKSWTLNHLFWVDMALGPAIVCLLAAVATGRAAPLRRLLDTRPIRHLGLSSYSPYLTHASIVVIVYEGVVAGRVQQGVPAFAVTLVIVLPLTVVFARIFASVFEIPFLRHQGSSAASGRQLSRAEVAPG